MWVRGQNKQLLIDCNKFELSEDETDIIFGNIFDNYYILGTYATKERCLEVLDEIERHINGEYKLIIKEKEKVIEQTFDKLSQLFLPPTESIQVITMPKVYQMPKE